jgi:hypothetical protein
MTADFRDFAQQLDRAAGAVLEAPLLRAKQQLARNALTGIVDRTPSLTGHARANWQVSIGQPATGIVPGGDPSGAATLSNGVAVILADRDPFATVWITNNAPYIQTLEQGGPDTAPAGMVAVTVVASVHEMGAPENERDLMILHGVEDELRRFFSQVDKRLEGLGHKE